MAERVDILETVDELHRIRSLADVAFMATECLAREDGTPLATLLDVIRNDLTAMSSLLYSKLGPAAPDPLEIARQQQLLASEALIGKNDEEAAFWSGQARAVLDHVKSA